MPVYNITRYPRELELRDGCRVTVRPMTADDTDAVLAFFEQVPADERFFLKEDVASPAVVRAWAEHLDYDRALPLLALVDGRVVGDATLIRRRGGSRAHLAEVRVVVAPEYRGRGLGVGLMRELIDIAYDAELERVIFELVKDVQDEAIEAARYLGAFPAGTVSGLAKDPHGKLHDVVFMALPLGKYWEWSRF